eukprot:GFUD01041784.1.p1 GENE.GFUD01041784.1~~GFUD01041784.1.p1  ORF type:complete len:383 (-),score=141.26 GFUD01041784.1:124-1272(-)
MDFLKAEIERKKRQIQEKNVLQPQKKYFKRGDLAAVQEAEYLSKYGPNKEDIEDLERKKNEALEEKGSIEINDALYPLPREEVVRRLRDKLEPIIMFGETEDQANLRMRALEIGEPDGARLRASHNNFQEALKSVDKQYLKAVQREDSAGDKQKLELKLYTTNKTWSELLELAHGLRRGDHKHDEMVISEWIKVIMTMWGHELNSRHEEEKMNVKGRMDAATFTQTKGYVKPLLKMLRKNQLTDDIRDSLSNMVRYIMQRDYILANEKYMEMAIGNAPWPIGVTNAGIHARPGRERIFSKHVAHVLNDESQRKYIQGLKRLMTKCQQYFVTDPSRSVDYIRVEKSYGGDAYEPEEPTERTVEFTTAKEPEVEPTVGGLASKD